MATAAFILSVAGAPSCDVPPLLRYARRAEEQFLGPGTGARAPWLAALRQWRADCRAAIKYDGGSIYNVSALQWTQTA